MTINPNQVNVVVTLDGVEVILSRRASPANDCSASPGCWDYNTEGQVELLGAACTAMDTASTAEVSIVVGCDTIVKQGRRRGGGGGGGAGPTGVGGGGGAVKWRSDPGLP